MTHPIPSAAQGERAPQPSAFTDAYGKLPAKNVERARTFYAENLGLTPHGENAGHLYYQIGGTNFMIFPSTGAPSGTHDQLGLVVDDLELIVARLRARGVTFEEYPTPPGAIMRNGIMDRGRMKAAWFRDTEGNLISIAEFPQGSPFRRR
ncbi:MAG: VOC family protein [Candidatus Dormibacteraeota bacterium]|nr:VOC family protein [Candidatus Dormibacteraeota bacterium]